MNLNIPRIMESAIRGVRAAMEVVRNAQGKPASEIEMKADETIVTATDRLSAEAAEPILQKLNIPLNVEDGVKETQSSFKWSQDLDSLDGTAAFAGGLMTSTVIWGLYNPQRRIIATIVGEPVSDRLWYATENEPTKMDWLTTSRNVNVCPDVMSKKTTVFIDVSHGFTRSGRQILTDDQFGRLFATLNARTKILMPGSNGLMHALVANGGTGTVGSITTALGGPWDALGALLVKQAGGSIRAFCHTGTELKESDPLCPDSYDILVCGNTTETVDALSETLLRVYRGTVPSLVKENITTCICEKPNWAGWAEETGRANESVLECMKCNSTSVFLADYKKRVCQNCGGIQIEITRKYRHCENCFRSGQ